MQRSDAWFQAGSRGQWVGQRSVMAQVRAALAQGRLVNVLAGIQHDANRGRSRCFSSSLKVSECLIQRLSSDAAPAPPNKAALARLNQFWPLPLRKYRAAPWAPRP